MKIVVFNELEHPQIKEIVAMTLKSSRGITSLVK